MRHAAIAGLAFLGIVAMGRPASAQSVSPDFNAALLAVASPASQTVTSAVETAEGVDTPEGVEAPEGAETPDGVEGPEGVEGPDSPGDTGPNIDHQFEGQETGENGNGIPGPAGGQ